MGELSHCAFFLLPSVWPRWMPPSLSYHHGVGLAGFCGTMSVDAGWSAGWPLCGLIADSQYSLLPHRPPHKAGAGLLRSRKGAGCDVQVKGRWEGADWTAGVGRS